MNEDPGLSLHLARNIVIINTGLTKNLHIQIYSAVRATRGVYMHLFIKCYDKSLLGT